MSGAARSAYPGPSVTSSRAGSRGGRCGSRSAAQRRDERADRADRAGRRVVPQVLDEVADGDHPAPGHDQPGQHRAVPAALQVDRRAGAVPGRDRPEHTEADRHRPLLDRSHRTALIGCSSGAARLAGTTEQRGTEMTTGITGFDHKRVTVADGVALNVAVGGAGRPIVLLHGFPQTHLMWRHVAADLAADHTVICPDLRGYGASDKPPARTDQTYAKRTMAADVVALARALGHDRFALAGHDRGALVAVRAGLDHPDVVTHLASLDVLPTLDMWDVLHGASAAVAFHLYLMAQPPGLPERMISASADAFFGHFLDAWSSDPAAIPAQMRAEYLRASREAVDLDRRRLPRLGRHRRGARPGGPGRRPAADHAGHRGPAGLGRGARLRRGGGCGGPWAPAWHRTTRRALHGRGSAGRDRPATPRTPHPLSRRSHPARLTRPRSARALDGMEPSLNQPGPGFDSLAAHHL